MKINDLIVANHEGGFVPFETDITSALRPNENFLQVYVKALTVSDRLGCVSQYAAHTVGGILRKVTMFVLPAVNIASQDVDISFDSLYRDAAMKIKLAVANEGDRRDQVTVLFRLLDTAGSLIKTLAVSLNTKPHRVSTHEVELKVLSPRK